MARSKRAAASKATAKLAQTAASEDEDDYSSVGDGGVEGEQDDEEECECFGTALRELG